VPISTLQTNDNHDLFVGPNGNINIISGVQALKQSIDEAVLMRLTEDIFNLANGVDYLGTAFSSPVDLDGFRVSLSQNIMKHSDVISIKSLAMNLNDNTLEWVAEILTVYGVVPVSSTGVSL